jgi:phage protein D
MELKGWTDAEVEENAYAAADTFRITLVVSMLPAETDASWFSNQTGITIEIFAGFPADPENFTLKELDSLIVGDVDDIEFSPSSGTIILAGRDKTARLIDTKTAEQFRSQTASQIATMFASEHGLDAKVTATTTKAGSYYAQHSDLLNTAKTEWDILMALAKDEGFICYVKGNVLYFSPPPTEDLEAYVLRWEPPTTERASPLFNGKSITFERKLTISRGISVVVTASQLNAKLPVKVVYPRNTPTTVAVGTSGSNKAKIQVFEIEARPGTSKAEATRIAQTKYHEIIAHEMRMNAELPGDYLLSTRYPLKVEGTGTAFDQMYFPDSIKRKLNVSTGYTMRASAKNRSPDNPV